MEEVEDEIYACICRKSWTLLVPLSVNGYMKIIYIFVNSNLFSLPVRLTKDVLKGKSFGDTIKPYLISCAYACVNMRATHNF